MTSKDSVSRDERLATIRRGRWIRYSRAEGILQKLDDLFVTPKSHRMSNLLIFGETNNGKSMIVNRFAKKHRPDINLTSEGSNIPVLVVEAPPVPDESRFYNDILTQIYAPFRASSRVDQRQLQVVRLLEAVGIRILIIDEIHNILAGTSVKQRQFLNMIKYLGNQLMIPIIGVGTQDAFFAINSDPQLANRFEPALVPKWKMDDEYLRLLASFERMLPLEKVSTLTEDAPAAKILALSEGTIGEISSLITAAASFAIRSASEQITARELDGCGYIPPSARKRIPRE